MIWRISQSSATRSVPANPAVDEMGQGRRVRTRIEPSHVVGRMRTHHDQEPFDRLEDARDPSESERRRAETDHLAVGGRTKRRTIWIGSAAESG